MQRILHSAVNPSLFLMNHSKRLFKKVRKEIKKFERIRSEKEKELNKLTTDIAHKVARRQKIKVDLHRVTADVEMLKSFWAKLEVLCKNTMKQKEQTVTKAKKEVQQEVEAVAPKAEKAAQVTESAVLKAIDLKRLERLQKHLQKEDIKTMSDAKAAQIMKVAKSTAQSLIKKSVEKDPASPFTFSKDKQRGTKKWVLK